MRIYKNVLKQHASTRLGAIQINRHEISLETAKTFLHNKRMDLQAHINKDYAYFSLIEFVCTETQPHTVQNYAYRIVPHTFTTNTEQT